MSDDPSKPDPAELPPTEPLLTSSEGDRQIGPYRLLQKLGEGGMGEVWLAEQSEPVKRRVALKIIKQGMDTKRVVARFEAERQALAMMDHRAVAKVFDAGTTPSGRPFFVMERVKGVPITEHCDRQRLTTGERLKLFCEVCAGVQHAHQKAIIHRDLKPSNVLVTEQDGKRLPKIIDFGVAKATAQKLTERTVYTELGALIGTPEYMSPEQAELTGEDVDTRTDVYSLGVMLYELLVGALPFDSEDLRSGGYDGIRKKIREVEPPKPSARLSTLEDERSRETAVRRSADLPVLRGQLRGDLDWIVMRAMEKDRARRYGSPSEVAADVERHLRHEPVLAGPPSRLYRARKFVRRHRFGVVVATTGIVALIGFATAMAVQAARIAAERDRADHEREASDRVSGFLADMLGDVDPHVLGRALWSDLRERATKVRRGRGATEEEVELTLANLEDGLLGVNATDAALHLLDKQVLARAAQTIDRQLVDDPLVAGRLEHTLGATYRRLGLYARAEFHSARAVEIRRKALSGEHPITLRSMNNLAVTYDRQGRYNEAERLHGQVLEIRRRVLGPEDPSTLWSMDNLATAYSGQGRHEEAEALHRATLAIRQRVLGPEHPDTLSSLRGLANACWGQGRYDEAADVYLETFEIRRQVMGAENPNTLWSMHNLAAAYWAQGRHDEAEQLHRETFELRRRVLGMEHPDTLSSTLALAAAYGRRGDNEEAEKLYRQTFEIRRRVLGTDHNDTVRCMTGLAALYWQEGRFAEAERAYREALEIRRRVLGDDHNDTVMCMIGLAGVYWKQGRFAEAEEFYREAFEIRRRVLGANHPDTADALYNLALVEAVRGDREKTMRWLRQAVDAGYAKPDSMTKDLQRLKGPEFEALVEQARANAAAQQQD